VTRPVKNLLLEDATTTREPSNHTSRTLAGVRFDDQKGRQSGQIVGEGVLANQETRFSDTKGRRTRKGYGKGTPQAN